MNEEQFQIRQLHPTWDPGLDPFTVKDRIVTVGEIVFMKKHFMGVFYSVLRTFL